jgi:uncharacterized membrane-anchored protein/uncharacterized membrane protein
MPGTFGRQGVGPYGEGRAAAVADEAASPAELLRGRLRLGAQVAAAGLIGFGVILWVAAHWDQISRFHRFALVGSALAASVLISLVNAARVPGLLLSFLATGGLLALIGQTYQTGADPWQLFALWAAVGLPWAFAARSDAVWVVWSVVAHVAVTLWMATFASVGWWTLDPSATMAGWGMALAISAVLSPMTPARDWIGDSKWAFRLSLLLSIALVTQSGLAALFSGKDVSLVYWLALLLLGGIAAAIVALPRLDLVLAAMLGLALDTLLICGFSRAILTGARDVMLPFLLIGLAGAALVAGTGALLLHVTRERGEGGVDIGALKGREWPLVLMTGIGALLTTIPLSGFLGLFIGPFLTKGPGPFVIGAIFLAGSVMVLRTTAQTSFKHQLAAIGLTLGFCLVAFGLVRDARGVTAVVTLPLALLATGLGLGVGRSWTASLLGAAAASAMAAFVNSTFVTPLLKLHAPSVLMARGWIVVLLAAVAWIVAVARSARVDDGTPALPFADGIERLVGGAIAAGLLGVMATAGPTFLLSGAIGGVGLPRHLVTGVELSWASLSVFSAALALAGCAWLLVPRPNLQTTLGLGASLIVICLSAVIPSLGVLVLLICVAMSTSRRAAGIGAFVAALWVIGAFYYWLGWPLSEKAALMLAAGVSLAVLCLLTGRGRPALGLGSGTPAPAALARGLALAGAIGTGALAAQAITSHEATLANGRQIYLALAPVDPRSLIQGDFMRLNFAVPGQPRARRADETTLGQRRWAIATVDARGVATIDKVVEAEPAPAPGQLVLPLRFKDRRWIVGTDAWFFREGTAEKWQRARFGVFRVGANGTVLLTAMADQDLTIIN